MVLTKRFKPFDNAILDIHPDLKDFLKPNDQYPELQNISKNSPTNLPAGSLNTKVIINNGKIVERIFKTPKGQIVSLPSITSNMFSDQVA